MISKNHIILLISFVVLCVALFTIRNLYSQKKLQETLEIESTWYGKTRPHPVSGGLIRSEYQRILYRDWTYINDEVSRSVNWMAAHAWPNDIYYVLPITEKNISWKGHEYIGSFGVWYVFGPYSEELAKRQILLDKMNEAKDVSKKDSDFATGNW